MGDNLDTVMRSIYLPIGIDAKLRQFAHETNRTRSDLIREFVAAGLTRMEAADQRIEQIAQAMLDDIGNADKLDMADPYRRIITVQLSSADLVGMARAAIEAAEKS